MAKGINKVILVGHLGQPPEMNATKSGESVCILSLATSESWTDKATGQKQERTEWHRIVAFKRLAEICGQYLTKGAQIYCEGQLRTRKWQDQQGNDRYTTEIVMNELQMLGIANNQGQQQAAAQPAAQPQYQPPQHQPPQQPQRNAGVAPSPYAQVPHATAHQQPAPQHDPNYFDDDIPF